MVAEVGEILVRLLPTPTQIQQSGVDLIIKTCNHTSNPNICVEYLRSDPQSLTVDVKGLARILLEMASKNANDTAEAIEKQFKKNTDPILTQCFEICISVYKLAVEDLPNEISSLDSNLLADALTLAGYASEDAEECEKVFVRPPNPTKSPFTKQNKVVDNLSTLAVEIISVLPQSG
ncbi:pectinesterase inhibitor-like [Malania oleifera]|uniref:pectinesterase inhibitor-like n=1 Tax=Malania oleifera TaxID=397392 RepID=UPI0025AEA8C3|nr:pectinesterase inhibitor-like [Malania oleifera]